VVPAGCSSGRRRPRRGVRRPTDTGSEQPSGGLIDHDFPAPEPYRNPPPVRFDGVMCGRSPLRKGNFSTDVRRSGADMCPTCLTRRAWPPALMRSADWVPINSARSWRRPVIGFSQSSVTTEYSSVFVTLAIRAAGYSCPAALFLSATSDHRWRLIVLLSCHNGPSDTGHFVGNCQ
jgi:hypothetical protein